MDMQAEKANFASLNHSMPDPENRNLFRKSERICHQNQIDKLFKEGKSLKSGFLRLLYVESDDNGPPQVQVLIAAPKKMLRLAVQRNQMKRRIREAYRKFKHPLIEDYAKRLKHLDIAIVFNGKQCVSQAETNTAIITLLDRLKSIYEKHTG